MEDFNTSSSQSYRYRTANYRISELLIFDILCYNIFVTAPLYWYGKGVFHVEILVSFLLSVMASVVAYYLCKWLDSDE